MKLPLEEVGELFCKSAHPRFARLAEEFNEDHPPTQKRLVQEIVFDAIAFCQRYPNVSRGFQPEELAAYFASNPHAMLTEA